MILLTLPQTQPERLLSLAETGQAPDSLKGLLNRARKGDQRALEQLCKLMRPHLYRVALSLLKDPDEADDIAQDALIRALDRHSLFVGSGSLKAWMCRIALNLAKNKLRDKAKRKELLGRASATELRPTHGETVPLPHQTVREQEIRQHVQAQLDRLPKRQREVIQLRLFAELSYSEIAKILRISEANARVNGSKGLSAMRSALTEISPIKSAQEDS